MRNLVYSRKDLIEYFIRQDYQISILNKNLETPLHVACYKGETEIAILLIKRSKNLNLQDHEGNTPLHKSMICLEKVQRWFMKTPMYLDMLVKRN